MFNFASKECIMELWETTRFEDQLLYKYWNYSKGNLFLEVPIGNTNIGGWPSKSGIRRIDGVIVIDDMNTDKAIVYKQGDYKFINFAEYIQGKTVELIEVKRNLTRGVIGQVIVGMDMFERQYRNSNITPVIICKCSDPALEWVCEKRNIQVRIIG